MYNNTGLIGHPLSHTLSPLIHNFFYFNAGVNGGYCCFDVQKSDLPGIISNFKKYNFRGFNITLPYKKDILEFADFLSEDVENIGAANTVAVRENKLYAYNTDIKGIIDTFKVFDVQLKNKRILVLGSGGSARPLFYLLKDASPKSVDIVNRTIKNTEDILSELKIQSFNIYDTFFLKRRNIYDIIVNTTSLGLKGDCFFDMENIECSEFLFDFQYNINNETPFLLSFNGKYHLKSDGLVMLISQAAESFNIFHGLSHCWDALEVKSKILNSLIEVK